MGSSETGGELLDRKPWMVLTGVNIWARWEGLGRTRDRWDINICSKAPISCWTAVKPVILPTVLPVGFRYTCRRTWGTLYGIETLAEETGVEMEEPTEVFVMEGKVVMITSWASKSACFSDFLSFFLSRCHCNLSMQTCTRDHLSEHHEAQWPQCKLNKQDQPK